MSPKFSKLAKGGPELTYYPEATHFESRVFLMCVPSVPSIPDFSWFPRLKSLHPLTETAILEYHSQDIQTE